MALAAPRGWPGGVALGRDTPFKAPSRSAGTGFGLSSLSWDFGVLDTRPENPVVAAPQGNGAAKPTAQSRGVIWRLAASLFFEVSDTGPRGRLVDLDEI